MILNLITLANIKIQLGIASGTTTYDASLTSLIPIISNDVRRILNYSFNDYVVAQFASGSADILISTNELYSVKKFIKPKYDLGQVIYHPNIPTDTYLLSYNPETGYYTMSANTTGEGSYICPGLNIAQWSAISKMIWYRYGKMNTTDSIAKNISSESYGPVSITYADSEINKQYDYPQSLINDLGLPYCKVG